MSAKTTHVAERLAALIRARELTPLQRRFLLATALGPPLARRAVPPIQTDVLRDTPRERG
jgi:hypothetical protein